MKHPSETQLHGCIAKFDKLEMNLHKVQYECMGFEEGFGQCASQQREEKNYSDSLKPAIIVEKH
jgi:hypothetical protein